MEELETQGAQVLVVDDTTLVRKIIVARLRGAGYRVAEATDGQEALELFRKQASPVVITDLNMPRLDGLGLLAALRQHPLAPEVILLTASRAGDAQAAVEALRLGAHDYIAKDPSAGDEVVLAVQRAAEKWRLREENARLVDDLRRLSLTDSLTNVGNRRAFDEALRAEIARARRHQRDLALVLFDLDHFKRINDTLGHRAGDQVLTAFAARLGSLMRASDRLFRYGGEEFALLLPDEGPLSGLEAARRLVRGIAEQPLAANGSHVAVTCSAGVAGLRESDASDGSDLVARSDAALYAAKRAGRNCALRADEPRPAARLGAAASLAVKPC
jgi:two-component system chemotaxis family response regulator WspR